MHVVVVPDAGVAEARDAVVAADHDAQGDGDVLDGDAQRGGALAVDVDAILGLVELERGVGVCETKFGGAGAEVLGDFRK